MLLRLFIALGFIHTVIGQTYPCLCNDPNYTSVWGAFTPTNNCSGVCEGFQQGHRWCHANMNGVVQTSTLCAVTISCQVPQGCTGTWTAWSDILCSSTCQQTEVRFCYQVTNFQNERSTLCLGAEGKSQQRRTRRCYKPRCLTEATTSSEEMTTSFQTKHLSHTTTEDFITQSDVIDKKRETKSNIIGKNALATPATVTGSNNIKFASILGSVALVCLTGIGIAIAVVVTRKKNQRKDSCSDSSGTAGIVTSARRFRNDDYEIAADPVLPGRPNSFDQSQHYELPLEYSSSVTNALYHPMGIDNDEPTFPIVERRSSGGGDYPLLLTPTSPAMKPESIYATIDENRRNC